MKKICAILCLVMSSCTVNFQSLSDQELKDYIMKTPVDGIQGNWRRQAIQQASQRGLYSSKLDQGATQEMLAIGMNHDQVILAAGKPLRNNRTFSQHGVSEQWVYPAMYVYFEDGKLVSIQD